MKKSVLLVLAMALISFGVSADTTTTKKVVGHDKEHQHVETTVDHTHDDAHHKPHDHKAHHPEHVESSSAVETTKKVETKKK